jgi:hypothetical protein
MASLQALEVPYADGRTQMQTATPAKPAWPLRGIVKRCRCPRVLRTGADKRRLAG